MRTDELRSMAMAMTAEQILKEIDALPEPERAKVLERAQAKLAERKQFAKMTEKPPILADLSDEEFEDFQETLRRIRQLPLRAP